VIGPRVPASPSIKKAQAWAVRQFEQWGLENVAVEPCGEFGPGWSNEFISVHLTEPSYAQITAFPKPFTSGTEGPIEGQPVIAVIKTREDMEKFRGKLGGAIVFVDEPREIEISFDPVARRLTESDLDEEMDTPIPVDRPKKDEVVMLGGHLDSWTGGTGAVDNGAGCAVNMATASRIHAVRSSSGGAPCTNQRVRASTVVTIRVAEISGSRTDTPGRRRITSTSQAA
jgi:hypothetical protein